MNWEHTASGVDTVEAVSIYAVIVLYRCLPMESSSLRTLLSAAQQVQAGALKLRILLYDNTPGRVTADYPEGIEYYSDGSNAGLAAAYNYACSQARKQGFDWLLTLDQDSQLPANFLISAARQLQSLRKQPQVGALVPQIFYGKKILSPYQLVMGGSRARWLAEGFVGIPDKAVYALNSGSILCLSALRQAGDYDPRFWLDASDTSVFHRLAECGKRVYVAGDIRLEHDFAMKTAGRRVSPDRYRSIIEAESAFCDLYLGHLASAVCTARLLVRVFLYRSSSDRTLRAVTQSMIALRLLHSRSYRLQRWRTLEPFLSSVSMELAPLRPKVSVCMATYNGQAYVEEQVSSILPQLGDRDELIVVDDGSQDRTLETIESLQSPQIHIIRHTRNQGVVPTFEDAIRNATGDIIFLSDMDDIWSPEKVGKILQIFRDDPDVTLVTSAVALIDEKGNPLRDNASPKQPPFKSGLIANFMRNRYQGSAMAFRSNLIPAILPIPQKKLFLHDVWIGLQNSAHGGKAAFVDEPLLFYRRHGGNVSRRLSRSAQFRLRLQLGWELAKSLVRRRVRLAPKEDRLAHAGN